MLETAIGDGAKKLGLQEEVAEAGRMDSDVGAFLVDATSSSKVALLSGGGSGRLVGLDLLIRVVDEILLGRHVGGLDF